MTIRGTQPANEDFLGIVSWIAASNRAAAAKVGQLILSAVEGLGDYPFQGKPGRSPGTRELMIPGLPYVVACSVESATAVPLPQTVVVLRVLHGAMLWSPSEGE